MEMGTKRRHARTHAHENEFSHIRYNISVSSAKIAPYLANSEFRNISLIIANYTYKHCIDRCRTTLTDELRSQSAMLVTNICRSCIILPHIIYPLPCAYYKHCLMNATRLFYCHLCSFTNCVIILTAVFEQL